MTDLENAKARLEELNKLIAEAPHPGAYINTLVEERRSVKFNIKMMEDEIRIDKFIAEHSSHFAALGVGPAELRGMIQRATRDAEWERTKDLIAVMAGALKA